MQSSAFLLLVAIAQPFNNLGIVGAGVLRGFKDTLIPMLASLGAFWGISFAGGWSLAFLFGFAAPGIWIGLTSGAIVYSLMIGVRLHRCLFRNGIPGLITSAVPINPAVAIPALAS